MSKMNPVVHFEMPAENKNRMAEFYAKAFGWKAQFLGHEMGNYVVVSTTESDKDGRHKTEGTINGRFFQKTEDSALQSITLVVGVGDINESMKKVKEAGGTVIGEPMLIPGIGLYVSFIDSEGNRLSMLQPAPIKERLNT